MEEILQILIFVGAMVIAVVGQNAKNKKKPTTTSPQEVLEDIFPDIEVDQEALIAEQEPTLKPNPVFKRTPRMAFIKPQPPQTPVSQSTKEKEKQKISLNNRKEARRAFIYSEIFNRKY